MQSLCLIAMVATILSLIIKEKVPQLSLLLSLACGIIILLSITEEFSEIISLSQSLFLPSMSELFSLLLKAVGIAYLTDFSSDLCRDAGENSIAKKLEIAGKISITAITLPTAVNLFEKIKDVFL